VSVVAAKPLLIDSGAGVAWITLNRPEVAELDER